jgi:hypothetical protein
MPPRPAPKGESKTGLVVTLVLFILLTLGLGVATYYGFAEQEKLTKEAKEAKNNAEIYKKEREWYRGQAWYYRAVIGKAQDIKAADLGTWKNQLDQGGMAAFKNPQPPEDKDSVSKLIRDDFDKKFGWNPQENRPLKTYEQLLDQEATKQQALEKRLDTLRDQVAKLTAKNKELEGQLAEAQANYQTALTQLQKKTNDDRSSDRDTIAKLENDIKKNSEKFAEDLKKSDDERRKVAEDLKKRGQEVDDLNKLLRKQDMIIQQREIKSVAERQAVFHPEWQIVRMDTRGTNPYINLGAADGVKPQLTFSIHGRDVDGKVSPTAKGTMEVVSVLGEHLSQTRITSVKDGFRDPIMKGDVLHNPSWDPNFKKHVVVAGVIDLTASGRDDTAEFIRNLQRQNVVVDAYVDTKTGKVKGRMSVDTDYLVVNEVIDKMSPRDRNPTLDQAMREAIRTLKEEAKKNGVQILGLRRYLEMIGYRMPRHMQEEADTSLYGGGLRPDLSPPPIPGDRPAGDKQPPDRQPGDRLPAGDK